MSQRIVFEAIQSFEGPVARKELKKYIEANYPDRTLSQYLGLRLSALKKKGAITVHDDNNATKYSINEEYSKDSLEVSIADFDHAITEGGLKSRGITVTNIVGGSNLCNEIDLQRIDEEITSLEYEPETMPMAVWRPFDDNSVSILIYSTGIITIVGSRNRRELLNAIDAVQSNVPSFCEGSQNNSFATDFKIHNIIGNANLESELELAEVSVGLGLENTEYDPEQFPGIIYRPTSAITTLIFRTGKVVLIGNTYENILGGFRTLYQDLQNIGVELE